MVAEETVKATVAALFAAIRAMDIEAWVSLFAEDAENVDPADAPAVRGRAAIREQLSGLAQTFQSVHIIETGVFVCGAEAAVTWTAVGVAKNGKTTRFSGVDVIVVNEAGQIRSLRAYWNPAAMLARIAD